MPHDQAPALTPEQWEAGDYRQAARDLDGWAKSHPEAGGDDATEYVAKLGLDKAGSVVVMNRAHDLEDTGNDHTFYAHLLEHLGFRFERRRVKNFVRFWIYILLGVMAVTWQVGFGQEALVF